MRAVILVLVLASGCAVPVRGRAPDPCAEMFDPPISSEVISDGPPGFWAPTTFLSACTEPCAQNSDCATLGSAAFCTFGDRCVVPCSSDDDCDFGTCTAERLCGRLYTGTSDVDPRWATGAALAVGAEMVRSPTDCAGVGHLTASASDGAVVAVGIDETYPDCAAVTLHALAVGATSIALAVDGVPTERWELEAREAALITIGSATLGGGALRSLDLERATSDDTFLVAIARDADGARVMLGNTLAWSLDDPELGTLRWSGDSERDASIAGLTALATGTTTLRARFRDLERAIPIDIALPE